MPSYNFKREAQVFVEDSGGSLYQIDISDVSFSQTFAEESYPVKTLHKQNNVFEASVINRANAANFSFTMPAITQADFTVVRDRLLDATSFSLFIQTTADTYKLQTAVITNGSFVIEKSRPLSIQIQGEASKLLKGQNTIGTSDYQTRTGRTYTIPTIEVAVGSTTLSDNVLNVALELQNEINWTPYATVHSGLSVTNASNTMYPTAFSINKKILSGSISQYLTDTNSGDAHTWDTAANITIKAGNGLSDNAFRGFEFGPATCSFTNRVNAGTVFTQSYDWRMTANPTNLSDVLNYKTAS